MVSPHCRPHVEVTTTLCRGVYPLQLISAYIIRICLLKQIIMGKQKGEERDLLKSISCFMLVKGSNIMFPSSVDLYFEWKLNFELRNIHRIRLQILLKVSHTFFF